MKSTISVLRNAILSNPREDWEIKKLAEIADVSPAHFQKLFKEETGITPIQFIKQIRLEKARELLETTFLRVQQIAYEAGIRDQSYFNRAFKEKYGLTPNQYREQNFKKLKSQKDRN